jgi:hypothetical protein
MAGHILALPDAQVAVRRRDILSSVAETICGVVTEALRCVVFA